MMKGSGLRRLRAMVGREVGLSDWVTVTQERIDAFEEALTVDPYDQEARHAFFSELGNALEKRDRWALFAMREEFVAGLDVDRGCWVRFAPRARGAGYQFVDKIVGGVIPSNFRPAVDNGYERQFTYVYGAVSPI